MVLEGLAHLAVPLVPDVLFTGHHVRSLPQLLGRDVIRWVAVLNADLSDFVSGFFTDLPLHSCDGNWRGGGTFSHYTR